MFNNVVLDVVIGLVFIYLLYSLLVSIIHEMIATHLAFRAKILEKAIARMLDDGVSTHNAFVDRLSGYWQLLGRTKYLDDKKFTSAFYGHPLIKYLAEDKWHSKPSYLAADNFSKVIVDLLHGVDTDLHGINVLRVKEALAAGQLKLSDFAAAPIEPTPDSPLKNKDINPQTQRFLQSLLADAQGDVIRFKLLLENWYDATMERATGWYKKYTQFGLLLTGFVVAIAFNVDTIAIVNKLSKDPKLRQQMIEAANAYVAKKPDTGTTIITASKDDSLIQRRNALLKKADDLLNKDINSVNDVIGLGWKDGFWEWHDLQADKPWWRIFMGWLVTALAISLGAPFWFDLLNKLVKMRGTGVKADSGSATITVKDASAVQGIIINTNKPGEEAVG
jgi:hypothetical protein